MWRDDGFPRQREDYDSGSRVSREEMLECNRDMLGEPRAVNREEQDALENPGRDWHSSHGTQEATIKSKQSYGIMDRAPRGSRSPPAKTDVKRAGTEPKPADSGPL